MLRRAFLLALALLWAMPALAAGDIYNPAIPAVVLAKSADYSVTAGDLSHGTVYINVDASGGDVTITIAPSLGSSSYTPTIVVQKVDTSSNIVFINNGSSDIDAIVTAATSDGQVGGFRIISTNGTNLRSEGVG